MIITFGTILKLLIIQQKIFVYNNRCKLRAIKEVIASCKSFYTGHRDVFKFGRTTER